ncbi:hypothetical protein EF847_01090 [Actinobacteria bacterium YIM 96077]|uniref:Uncharacterized protein n=1 Tax=Phytoactinopolyspora halophila TaxID=1981511 RepID=A0A329R040_9ACTN|nr:hypothetical protein [Phytoactinopolyspora halophila]AYY11522.1 hypothetical protein EF847_01090 [Actinobacteria bacterium YIM 96077]RAW17994.1 hypothetical protein DPM12_03915 [Phytoactinopolyspora halophila]
MMNESETTASDTEPVVENAVQTVRDRFGASGLRTLIALANRELARVEQAEASLAILDEQEPVAEPTSEPLDAADTQAWLAYTEIERE